MNPGIVHLSIGHDPRDLWFQAGYSFSRMQIAQWSQDLHSAARALERFLQDDCDFTPIHISAKTALTTKPIVVLGLDQKSLQ